MHLLRPLTQLLRRIFAHPPHTTRNPRTARNPLAQQAGVSLVWVLAVILVILIAFGAALLAVSTRFNITAVEHERQQAHYTAHSALETSSRWIAAGFEQTADPAHRQEVEALLNAAKQPSGVSHPLVGLSGALGECALHLVYTNAEQTSLKLTATATFAGASDTLSITMHQGNPTIPSNNKELAVPRDPYSPSTPPNPGNPGNPGNPPNPSTPNPNPPHDLHYDPQNDTRATEIAALSSGGIVALYDSTTANNSTKNNTDRATLNAAIPNANSTKEARWTNVDVNGVGEHHSRTLGTQRYPVNGRYSAPIDNRRFLVPLNGRIMIDPMENGVLASTNERDLRNTKISTLAIDETAGKDVLFRLASGSAAVHPTGATRNRSLSYLNSLLMFNFTDDANSTETVNYTPNSGGGGPNSASGTNSGGGPNSASSPNSTPKSHTWHPNHWNKLDLYVQPNAEVTSNLLLGPFGHKFNDYIDFWSWGNYVDNWHGATPKEYQTLWPYASEPSTNAGNHLGLPIFPVDFGKNANFWILDGRNNRYFRVMQGVNIIEGTIYSTRPTLIGGGLLRDGTGGLTKERVNESMWGYSYSLSTIYTLYVDAVVRYSQLLHDTDIILKPPTSGTAQSRIQPPYTWRQKTIPYNSFDKNFEPTMTIKGGSIYVGERQELTIQGATLDNMWISPDRIVVAKGATLTIESSAHTNVLTNIYVDGGALIINAGAKIQGNIYVYNGGTVEKNGAFQLDSPHNDDDNNVLTDAEAKDGIHIYGAEMVGIIDGVTSPGALILPATGPNLGAISGSSNKVHHHGTVGTNTVHKPNGQGFSASELTTIEAALFCDSSAQTAGICSHFGFLGGGWMAGSYERD